MLHESPLQSILTSTDKTLTILLADRSGPLITVSLERVRQLGNALQLITHLQEKLQPVNCSVVPCPSFFPEWILNPVSSDL